MPPIHLCAEFLSGNRQKKRSMFLPCEMTAPMSISLLHEWQIDVEFVLASETCLFTLSKKKLISPGDRSYPQLPTAKVAASMVVITGSAQRGVLIGRPVLFREPCQSKTAITPTTCALPTISTGTMQYVSWSNLEYFQEMFICGHLTLGSVDRMKHDESVRVTGKRQ